MVLFLPYCYYLVDWNKLHFINFSLYIDCHKTIRARRRSAPAGTQLGSPSRTFLARPAAKRRRVYPLMEYNTIQHDREVDEREALHDLYNDEQEDDVSDVSHVSESESAASTPAATTPAASPVVAASPAAASPGAIRSPAAASPAAPHASQEEEIDDFDPIAAIDALLTPHHTGHN